MIHLNVSVIQVREMKVSVNGRALRNSGEAMKDTGGLIRLASWMW